MSPHPLQGGTPQHKVPALLTQIFNEYGCIVYRPSFRGLGGSEGVHDEGHGETEDILAVIEHVRKLHAGLPFMQVALALAHMFWQNVMRSLALNYSRYS